MSRRRSEQSWRLAADLQLDWFHQTAVAELFRLPTSARSAARSALRYMHRAKLLADTMPELSWFCVLPAEEEAAKALFRTMQHCDCGHSVWREVPRGVDERTPVGRGCRRG